MKNCAFQYATGDGVILHNTPLISRDEADRLWDDHIDTFKEHMESEREPEMAIWIDMENDCDYHTTAKHWHAVDFILKDGQLYSAAPVA